jgi:hypothetical protein
MTLTVPAGAATYTVRPKDVAGNETAAVGSVAATATSGGPLPTAIGWHPGDSVSNWRDSGHLNNQVTRFGEYDQTQFAANCNIKGAHYLAPWAQLEGPTHGSYASGFALIHAEINHLKALSCPKWLILQVFDELNYSITQSMSGQASYYPAYLNTAGCLAQGVEGGGGGGGVITHVADWNPTCRSYVLDLIAAYGAEFNGEPYFEAFAYPYERIVQTCCQLNGYSAAAYDSATRVIAQAMRTAFPNKIVFMTLNWYTGDATQFSSLVAYLASIGVGWGPGDMIYVAGASSPTFYYQTIDKLTVGALGGPDYRGVVPLMWRYEATELGYTGNGDSQRGYTGAEIYNYVNNSIHANYLINERNIFIGGNASRWYNCDPDGVYNRACSQTSNPGGLLIRINTPTPLTHLACPTNFDTLFGNGSAGSGCNTGY